MANLPETPDYPAGVYQLETSDPVLGGAGGIANRQAEQLANRTAWLKAKIDAFLDGTVAVLKATKLATARTLSFSGAASGSAPFDGSADANIVLTLADSGAVAGTYPKVTVNAKGVVTAGAALVPGDIPNLDWSKINSGKPTTLGGYGITDAAPLASPIFTGDPKAPTPQQFDNDTSLATTEFLQRALGNFRVIVGLGASYVVTASDAGKVIAATAAGMTLTLPALSSVPSGGAFTFHCNNTAGSVTIACSGAETIQYGSKPLASMVLQAGDAITLVSDGATSWTPVVQSAGVAKQSFAAVRTASPQAISSGVSTKVQFNSEEFDPHGVYDHVSTFRFRPTIPGKYLLSGNVQVTSPSSIPAGSTPAIYAAVHKNGAVYRIGSLNRFSGGGVVSLGSAFSVVVDANGTDYFEIYAYHDTGLANVTISATAETHFSAARIL